MEVTIKLGNREVTVESIPREEESEEGEPMVVTIVDSTQKFRILKSGDVKRIAYPKKLAHVVIDPGIHRQLKSYCDFHGMSLKNCTEVAILSFIRNRAAPTARLEQ